MAVVGVGCRFKPGHFARDDLFRRRGQAGHENPPLRSAGNQVFLNTKPRYRDDIGRYGKKHKNFRDVFNGLSPGGLPGRTGSFAGSRAGHRDAGSRYLDAAPDPDQHNCPNPDPHTAPNRHRYPHDHPNARAPFDRPAHHWASICSPLPPIRSPLYGRPMRRPGVLSRMERPARSKSGFPIRRLLPGTRWSLRV